MTTFNEKTMKQVSSCVGVWVCECDGWLGGWVVGCNTELYHAFQQTSWIHTETREI